MGHRLADALAHVTVAAVPQFMGLMGAGAGAAWNNGPTHGATFKHHLRLNGWIAAGIEYLSGHDGVDDEVERVDHGGRGVNRAILWVALCTPIVIVRTPTE